MSTRSFIGTPAPFSEVFPDVKSLEIVATEFGDFPDARNERSRTYRSPDISSKIRCSNPRCQQGGYDLQPTLQWLTGEKQESYSFDWSCNGHEGTPKGRRKGDPCMNSIKGEISIKYK